MAGFFSSLLQQQQQPPQMAQPQPKGFLGRLAGGLNRFSDELLAPTTGLGKLGMYLGAATGGDLGTASMLASKDARTRGDDDLERQYKQAQIAKLQSPQTYNNDTISDYNFLSSTLGKDTADKWLTNYAEGTPVTVDAQQYPGGPVVRQVLPRSTFNAPAPTTSPVQIQSEDEYNALPPNTPYIAPDGTQRVKS